MHKATLRQLGTTLICLGVGCNACESRTQAPQESEQKLQTSQQELQAKLPPPPFTLSEHANGLMLTWFDAEGLHTVTKVNEVPDSGRQYVRVRSLATPPEQRLDPAYVYVADLRQANAQGHYPISIMHRKSLDALIDKATGAEAIPEFHPDPSEQAATSKDIVVYSTSWCGACKATVRLLREKGVNFVEKDIEKDSAARDAMVKKLRAVGKSPGGVPVIDFQGQLIQGFNQPLLERLINETKPAT